MNAISLACTLLVVLIGSQDTVAIKCWECPSTLVEAAVLDCRSNDNDYWGKVVDCANRNTPSQNICWKKLDEDAEMTYRGCVPENEVSPFSDDWQDKNRCTTRYGKKTCTCDEEDVCNGVHRAGASWAAMLITAAAVLFMARQL